MYPVHTRMDPLLVAAIKAGARIVHLVTVDLPAATIRWTDGGYVPWSGQVYRAIDDAFGALDGIGEIVDGIDDDASPVTLSILAPTLTSIADLAAADAQGGAVAIHLGATGSDGQLIGDPYRLFIGQLDQPRLLNGEKRVLAYDILTADAFGLQPNEEQRQSNAFHQSVWPGELGYIYQTEGTKADYWREDEPKLSIDFIRPRGRTPATPTEFNYDADAGWPFPFGRVAVSPTLNNRVGYGPTNRYKTLFSTVAASGPIKAFIAFTADDELTTFDSTLNKAENGQHKGFMWLLTLPGDQPQAALTTPTGVGAGAPAPGWGADHKQSGKAVMAWTGFENSKKSEFNGGVPRMVHTIEGLFGWDARLEDYDVEDRMFWPWISDGATAALNWAVGRWEGDSGGGLYGIPYACSLVGGIGAPLNGIDVAAFVHAADVADANGWTVSAVPYSNDDKIDVLEDLLQAAGARRSRKCGMISCVSHGAAQESLLTVTEADTAGPVEIPLYPSRLDRKNTGIARFRDEEHRWEMTAIAPVTDAAWLSQDGGKRSTGTDYPDVPHKDQAAQLIYYDLANAREARGEQPFKPYLLALEPGDCFDWAAPEFLLETKAKVERRRYDPSTCILRMAYATETDAKHTAAMAQTGDAPPPSDPDAPPPRYGAARVPTRRTSLDETELLAAVTSATETTITIAEHKAWFDGAPPEDFESDTITGLTGSTIYGVFGRDGGNYEVEVSPALTHLNSDEWVFMGWQATPDGSGVYPTPDVPPPGAGGDGGAPGGLGDVIIDGGGD